MAAPGEWVRVESGRKHFCALCKRFFEGVAWCYFPKPALTTMTVCESCAEAA